MDSVSCNWCGENSEVPYDEDTCPVCSKVGFLYFLADVGV